MSATTTRTSNPTDEAGVPPAPSEAHQRAYVAGDIRVVIINGSQIRMEYDGRQWWNVSVTTV